VYEIPIGWPKGRLLGEEDEGEFMIGLAYRSIK
jgi:hypothetical protein